MPFQSELRFLPSYGYQNFQTYILAIFSKLSPRWYDVSMVCLQDIVAWLEILVVVSLTLSVFRVSTTLQPIISQRDLLYGQVHTL